MSKKKIKIKRFKNKHIEKKANNFKTIHMHGVPSTTWSKNSWISGEETTKKYVLKSLETLQQQLTVLFRRNKLDPERRTMFLNKCLIKHCEVSYSDITSTCENENHI